MLILSRYPGQSITIGSDPATAITVSIHDVRRGDKRVWLGIVAPKSIAVHRKEVADEIAAEGEGRKHKIKKEEREVKNCHE